MDYPRSCYAAVVREFGKEIEIEEVPIPQELEDRALLVKIECASICGTDVHLWEGSLSIKVDLPVILGHEMVGRVVAMGRHADVDSVGQSLKIGDRVIWSHTNCGSCYYCTVEKQPTLCVNRKGYMYETMEKPPYLMGGFAQYGYVVPESGRIRIPDRIDERLASLSSCAFRSVISAMDQTGPIRNTDTVLIQGTGPLGLLAIGVAKISGAKNIIAIGAPDLRLDMAKEFGADQVISIEKTGYKERMERIKDATNGRGPDVVFEFSGNVKAFAEGLDLIAPGGRYMVVGQLGDDTVQIPPSMITKKNLRVMGSFSGDISHYWKAIQFIEKHQHDLPFHKLISNEYSLKDINTALKRMQSFQEIKPVLYPWK
ncbi:zinc-binding dehydrogenase [Ammoniphilus resinae]|uniref:Threonine dehydrogenase-like Zn-dependent dehydrogenase n=1 Tax=Ammoniphilus resinae TaxID=861532 RepID=A0ABS4GXC5_9BACL|nr:zinc-binding dehydrogenase [Ammoniphilus resinae]MBP1934901.1 threonine dehydrogenase-like Zn-dependent dehydrogenase [Ammoniphilus resinae]